MSEFDEMNNDIRVLRIKFCGSEQYREFELYARDYMEFRAKWERFEVKSWMTLYPKIIGKRVSINPALIEMIVWDDRPEDPKYALA